MDTFAIGTVVIACIALCAMSFVRGREVWKAKYDELREKHTDIVSRLDLMESNLQKTIQRSENYKRMRDEQKERWRLANNNLQTIWAVSDRENARVLLGTIDECCRENQKFIPDPTAFGFHRVRALRESKKTAR